MKKILIVLLSVICLSTTACYYENQITKLYFIEKYKVHEAGVEVWAVAEEDEDITVTGIFIKHEDVYSCEEDVLRVVTLYDQNMSVVIDDYLYFSEEDYKEYIKERYDID